MKDPFFNPSKSEMLNTLNDILRSYYGANTKVSAKVERLPKATIAKLYEVAWLWRNDPIAAQVQILDEWIAAAS